MVVYLLLPNARNQPDKTHFFLLLVRTMYWRMNCSMSNLNTWLVVGRYDESEGAFFPAQIIVVRDIILTIIEMCVKTLKMALKHN